MTVTTGKTEKTPPTQTKGEAAVRHLWTRAVDDGDEEKAKTIAVIANLLAPNIKLAAGTPAPKTDPNPEKVDSAEIEGQSVDLSGMSTSDAEAYAAYASEMDGSAALARHIADLEERDEEDRRIGAFHDGS